MKTLDLQSDNCLVWGDPHDALDGDQITDAVIVATVKDQHGNPLASCSLFWDDDDLRYEGVLSAASIAGLVEGVTYIVCFSATGSATAYREVPHRAEIRGAC